jgi:hypothetical protein
MKYALLPAEDDHTGHEDGALDCGECSQARKLVAAMDALFSAAGADWTPPPPTPPSVATTECVPRAPRAVTRDAAPYPVEWPPGKKWRVDHLKALCDGFRLETGGKKPELVERLRQYIEITGAARPVDVARGGWGLGDVARGRGGLANVARGGGGLADAAPGGGGLGDAAPGGLSTDAATCLSPTEQSAPPPPTAPPPATVTPPTGDLLKLCKLRMRLHKVSDRIVRHMAHKLRKKYHADVQDKWISELLPDEAVCIIDYKMKYLHKTFLQAKGEMIGQAGVSIHIMYFTLRKPDS